MMKYVVNDGFLHIVTLTLLALLFSRLFVKDLSDSSKHEFSALDGLRGFMAFGVFLHHASYWINYHKDDGWHGGLSHLYGNLGNASVGVFFMLTGFLFSVKLIDSRGKDVDWGRIFISRLMRLGPLYFTLLAIMLCIAVWNSNFVQISTSTQLRSQLITWLLFTVPGYEGFNGQADMGLYAAGVIWTLPYEWFFYFMLPTLGLLLGVRSQSVFWLSVSLLCIVFVDSWALDKSLFYSFLGGVIAATIVRGGWFRPYLSGTGAHWLVLAALVIGYSSFHGRMNFPRLMLFTFVLSALASGVSVFGLFTSKAARALSTVSYGVYLLHGLVLYVVFMFVIPLEDRLVMSVNQFWGVIYLCTPIIIGVSAISWYWIEAPAIKCVSPLNGWVKKHIFKDLTDTDQSKVILLPPCGKGC